MASSPSKERIDKQLMEARKIRNKVHRVVKTPGVRRHAPALWKETMATLHAVVGFWQAQQTLRKHDSGTAAAQTPRTRSSSDSEGEFSITGRERKADDLIGSVLANEQAAVVQFSTVDNRPQPKHPVVTKRKADNALEARGTKRRQFASSFGLKSDCESEIDCDSSSSSLASKIWKERLGAPGAELARFREARAAAPPEPPASQSCTSGMGHNSTMFDRPWPTIPRPRAEEFQCLGVKARVYPQEGVRHRTETSLNQYQECESSATHASLLKTNVVVSDKQCSDSGFDFDPDFEAKFDSDHPSEDFDSISI
ncbi:hypothetical protein E6O75_ATG10345 [Venturia nashicola]|uniref:Uncharacterized protein n=1 Tax=Venturia nashicola TaxID=86259 RepID=A0A4Z1NPF5_9PEZI|nr:hypothetical protein E6O75_ATG10345 [Venturia nashicola]